MKKIIAAAVASAFIAPAFAADITISGDVEFQYRAPDGADNSIAHDGVIMKVVGTSELDNGWTVSADMPFELSGGSDGGESITLKGDGMTIDFGDVSGALDAVGDYSDVAPEAGGFAADGNDAGLSLSMGVGAATLNLSHSPKGGSHGAAADFNSYSVKMPVGPAEVYVGSETHGDDTKDVIAYGVKASFGGAMVAAEYADYDSGASATGLAVTYKMGSMTIGAENQSSEDSAGADTADLTVMFAKYSLGGGVTAYVESATNDYGTDQNTLGLSFTF